jgi:hypothetical protein
MSHDDAFLNAIDPRYRVRAAAVLGTLEAHFIEMPRGDSFCERSEFQRGYDALLRTTRKGSDLTGDAVLRAIADEPRAWLVLRCIIGMSPGEVAYLAVQEAAARGTELVISQTDAREIDARAKRGERLLFDAQPRKAKQRRHEAQLRALVPLLVDVMSRPVPPVAEAVVHRSDKLDTVGGSATIVKALSAGRVPYSELLYERLLGRPFASHRDSVSDIVGRIIEDAVNELLVRHGIDGRATRYRERVPTFKQAPDFLIPSVDPRVIVEAKLTEDDGTARDKVARVQTLRQYEDERPRTKRRAIVAVIDGRGFGYRPADLDRLLNACDGYVYTLEELEKLVGKGGPLRPYVRTRRR